MNCKTNGGNKPNQNCTFPFRWNGKKYKSCVFKIPGAWCSTKVNNNGSHLYGHWGTCTSRCPVEKYVKSAANVSMRAMGGNLILFVASQLYY